MARLGEVVRSAAHTLAQAGVASADHDARALAAHVLGVPRLPFILDELPAGFEDELTRLVTRRAGREPLQHILGEAAFRYLTVTVEPGVFVPRPETEVVAQVAIDEAARLANRGISPVVVDLCCGTGAVALSVATEVPGARVIAVDASEAAVDLTLRNAARVGAQDVEVMCIDVRDPALLGDSTGVVDVVVSNPPYIPPDAIPLDPEVRDYDPGLALYGGGLDGLEIPTAVIVAAARLLRPGGLLVMEHADVQGEAARIAAEATGAFNNVRTLPDLTGRERMLVASRR